MLFFIFSFLCACATTKNVSESSDPDAVLSRMAEKIAGGMEEFGNDLKTAAEIIGKNGLTGPEAEAALKGVYDKHMAYMVDCSTIDANGVMTAFWPLAFKKLAGTDISDHPSVEQMRREHKPALSDVFNTAEKIPAVAFEWPVFDGKGEWIGSISALFKSDLYMKELIKGEIVMSIYDAWILGKGGKFFYNPDPNENGKNIFTNPYNKYLTEFVAIGKRITEEPEGVGEYRLIGPGQGGNKLWRCHWRTITVHNAQVRVVLVEKL